MNTFSVLFLSSIGISLLSITGVALLFFSERILQRILIFFVAFTTGTLMGASLLHLLPEGIEISSASNPFLYVLVGFSFFYLVERLIHRYHAARSQGEHTHLGALSLFADGFHNFIDGIILASAFLVNTQLGIVTALAVASHEIPQEIAEFGVLLYSGFKKKKAILLNLLSASTVILGAVAAFIFRNFTESWADVFLLFGAGTFLYLGASAFMPEIRKREETGKTIGLFAVFLTGIILMWFLESQG